MADNTPGNDRSNTILKGEVAILVAILAVLALVTVVLVVVIRKPAARAVPAGTIQTAQQNAPAENAPQNNAKFVAVGFHVGGRVAQMFFAEQAQVNQGDVLASLDKAPFEAALADAQARLKAAQAEYNQPIPVPTDIFNAVEAARASLEAAQHAHDTALAALEERRQHVTAGQQDNVYDDDVQNEHDTQLDMERARRELAHQQELALAATNKDREVYKTAMQNAQADVALAEAGLANTQLIAPAAGTVASRVVDVGANVQADAPVYTLSVPY